MLCIIIIIILLYLLYNKNIETFITFDTDDVKFFPVNDGRSGKGFEYMPTSYHMELQKNKETGDGLISYIRDYMGKDDHYYLFKAPLLKDDKIKKIQKDINKDYTAFHRPLYLPGEPNEELKRKHYKELENQDKLLINDPFKYPYRNPNQLGNKIVYDFSNSLNLQSELEQRRLLLMGFRRPILTEENDFTTMTFCGNIDEEGNDFPCHKYGLEYDYDMGNQMKLAKNDDYSANICCRLPL